MEVVDSHDASAGREESHHLDVVSVAAQDVVVEEYYPHREGESVNYQLLPTDTAVVVAYADPGLVSNSFLIVCVKFVPFLHQTWKNNPFGCLFYENNLYRLST